MAISDPPHQDSMARAKPSRLRGRLTLAALGRASRYLSLTAVAKAAGLPRQTLFTRLRRGRPEITVAEDSAITATLAEAGLDLRPAPDAWPPPALLKATRTGYRDARRGSLSGPADMTAPFDAVGLGGVGRAPVATGTP
jgi:DNA-binding phage protein